jgi:ABC-2 type transport system permease protein
MREATYRADFFIWSVVTIGWFIFNIVFWQLLFANVDSIAGWSKGQVFVLQGFYLMLDFVIWGIFYGSLRYFPQKVHRGELDFHLTKPVNAQFLVSFNQYNLNQLTSLMLGVCLLAYGLNLDQISPSITDIIYAFIIFLIGSIFIYSGYFITVCAAFWLDRLNNIVYLFPGIRAFYRVPRPAYRGYLGIIFTFIIPATLITTLPSKTLFGQYSYQLVLYLFIFALITLKLSNWIFKRGLMQYSSANS